MSSSSIPSQSSMPKVFSRVSGPIPVMPTNNDFDQSTARQLLRYCGTLIVENFPTGSEFGIDLSIHYSGQNFLGLKMIPPGLHFVHFSVVNRQGAIAPRTGFFHYFESGKVLVTRFVPEREEIEEVGDDDEQTERFKAAFQAGLIDNRLGAYQFSEYSSWVSLTDFITRPLFERLNPLCGKIYSASTLVYRANSEGVRTASVDQLGLPDMEVAPETSIRFFSHPPVKHFLYPDGSTPDEITVHSMDSSYTLQQILAERDNDYRNLLGELQFAFVTFLVGHVFDGFEFWRDMLRTLCSVQRAMPAHCDLYLAFIRVVHFQLRQTNEAIFADIVDNQNQVFGFIRLFLRNLQSHQCDNRIDAAAFQQLQKRANKFRQSLKKSLKWNFDNCEEDTDDELPTVVLLTE